MFDDLLNTMCTIQIATTAQNANSYQMIKTWTTHASSVACRLEQASGGVRVSGNDILSKTSHILFLDYRTDIDWSDKRIVVGSNTFNILLVSDAGGEGHHLELSLKGYHKLAY